MTGALLAHLWQSTLFCGVVWLLASALRANRAALRHTLWQLASLKFLVPFSALYQIGAAAGWPAPVGAQPDFFVAAVDVAMPVVTPNGLLAVGTAGTHETPWWIAIWIIGGSIVAFRWIMGWRAAQRISRAARLEPGATPDVLITDALVEPSVASILRPVVLLPAALLGKLSERELRAVLAHEREHIARRDLLRAAMHRVVESVFWFHPLVWWIGRRMVEERERACDEAVLELGHQPADYAAGILAVCRHCCAHAPAMTLAHASALGGDLAPRIRHILAAARPASVNPAKALALLICSVAAGAVPVIAGAVDDAARRYLVFMDQSRGLDAARFFLAPAVDRSASEARIEVHGNVVTIRHSTLRELIALAYGVHVSSIGGGGPWLDGVRYDVRAELPDPVAAPEQFDPRLLQRLVPKLLAVKFDLELHVNRQCQAPCGRHALSAPPDTR